MQGAGRLVALADKHAPGDDSVQARVGEILGEDEALRVIRFREMSRAVSGTDPTPTGNITKLLGAEHGQKMADLALSIVGQAGAVTDGEAGKEASGWLASRGSTIAGGTSESSRNQIGERVLGLPRDPLIK
jgi:alkylation response protein AidB-like acyl-CoA dehydrogenase